MLIRDDASSLEITLRERGPAGTPSEGDLGLRVAAANTSGTFTGRNATVWVGRDDWAGFLEALRDLSRSGRGRAQVRAMSPEEFQLAIFASDRAGHLAAEGWVGRESTGRNGTLRDRVSFSIALDLSTLERLTREFASLGAAV
jgi:hypothetical protein